MKNWSGYISWKPSQIFYPETEEEIQKIVKKALSLKKKIRIIGSGHSFTRLSSTSMYLISLDKYQGLIDIDTINKTATVKAGTKLFTLGELLFQKGLAMVNMGDIDRQSIAGTISTGTHGTGTSFKSISNQVVALRFVNGKGEVVTCSEKENKDLFKAAQVSLGSLGIITGVTIQCVDAYKLRLQNRKEQIQDVLKDIEHRNKENRNFEFYWFPYTTTTWTKSSNITQDSPDKVNIANLLSEYVLENGAFKLLCELGYRAPSRNSWISKISAASTSSFDKVYYSHKVYATQRLVKFNEMEYNVPAENFPEVWSEVTKKINSKEFNIHFPLEVRFVKGDDIYLSPAYGRDSAYIACHVYNKKDPLPYFKAMEEIFRAFDGRPHWGKMNSLSAPDVAMMYPMYKTFIQHRREQDPHSVFMSDYLNQLLGG